MHRVPADGRIDLARARDPAARQSQVGPLHRARLQLAYERELRRLALRDDEKPARVLVEAVQDTGAREELHPRRAVQERVQLRPGPVAAAWVAHQARGFGQNAGESVLWDH